MEHEKQQVDNLEARGEVEIMYAEKWRGGA